MCVCIVRSRGPPCMASTRPRAACSEAAHDGPLRNTVSERTIVCRLAVGHPGLCCWCTSATSAAVRPAAGGLPRMARGARRAPSSPHLVALATTLTPY